jgi:hypothetical protein
MDQQLIVQFVEASYGTDFNAVSELATIAFAGNDMCHNE